MTRIIAALLLAALGAPSFGAEIAPAETTAVSAIPFDGPPAREEFKSVTAESFGTVLQVTTIGAADFRPVESTTTWAYDNAGHIYRTGGGTAFWAPIHLDPGALVDIVCYIGYDTAAADSPSFDIGAYELDGAGTPGFVLVHNAVVNHSGYFYRCYDLMPNYTIIATGNPDGDGTLGTLAYRAVAYLPQANNTQRLGGVALYWKRQVSPMTSLTYDDVPAGHPFNTYITALTQAGISAGCGNSPKRFCPDHPVTRAELAMFLAKALGLYWE